MKYYPIRLPSPDEAELDLIIELRRARERQHNLRGEVVA